MGSITSREVHSAGGLIQSPGFKEDAGIGGGGGGTQNAIGILWCCRYSDSQAWDMGEDRFETLRMLGARSGSRPLLGADNDGRSGSAACNVADVGGLIDDLIQCHQHEVAPHNFDDGLHAHQGRAHRRAQDGALGYRSVEDSIRAIGLLQTARRSEDTSCAAHVFSIDEDVRSRGQLPRQCFVDGLDITDGFCLFCFGCRGGSRLEWSFGPHMRASLWKDPDAAR